LILIDGTSLSHDIQRLSVEFDLPWPTHEELEAIVKQTYQRVKQRRVEDVTSTLTRKEMEQLINTLRGLTPTQVERIVTAVILDDFTFNAADILKVVEAKRELLGSLGCLETISVDVAVEDVGGLGNLKRWLKVRRGGFSRKAEEFGLEPPRGVLMLGVPGCGKSLCARAVAADWSMPLLRLDPGVLYQKFIGESESRLRQALKQAEAMAPAVLWVDEIEKAFASASSESADGGLSKRMFGTLLSWMQDHRHPIFIIATANDVSALPPELMRKGRFDEVFFVDLPSCQTRAEILAIHLRRRGREPKNFDLDSLAQTAGDFSGSELEQAVTAALFRAFSENKELSTEHLLAEIKQTRPLAVLSREQVHQLRTWAAERCVLAD
jgi:SpoVK/Ycf46/Vps4 family AAA+-type ATPase